MDKILQVILFLSTVLFFVFIIQVTRKKRLNYKLTILWLICSIFLVILSIFPQIVVYISKLLHIETAVNALFLIFIFLLLIINFFISIELSILQSKVIILVQENGLLRKKIEELKEENLK